MYKLKQNKQIRCFQIVTSLLACFFSLIFFILQNCDTKNNNNKKIKIEIEIEEEEKKTKTLRTKIKCMWVTENKFITFLA